MTDQPVAVSQLQVWNAADAEIQPRRPTMIVGRQWSYAPEIEPPVAIPLFTVEHVDFGTCIPNWFQLAREPPRAKQVHGPCSDSRIPFEHHKCCRSVPASEESCHAALARVWHARRLEKGRRRSDSGVN